jgi:hypothetical protein
MTPEQQTRLQARIGQLLDEDAAREWEIGDLEQRLSSEGFAFHTFDVRDAVWRLVGKRKAYLTRRLSVRSAS